MFANHPGEGVLFRRHDSRLDRVRILVAEGLHPSIRFDDKRLWV
jgi:hypothetical protein